MIKVLNNKYQLTDKVCTYLKPGEMVMMKGERLYKAGSITWQIRHGGVKSLLLQPNAKLYMWEPDRRLGDM